MLTEDFCSFEVAKLLKEKGFNEPCYRWYNAKGDVCVKFINPDIPLDCSSRKYYLCPSQSMAMKWLREVHQLHISVDVCPIYGKIKDEKGRNTCGLLYWHYMASGEWMNDKYNPQQKAFVVSAKSYEEAVEAACIYSLENLV